MTKRFELVFPSIPQYKIIDLATKRVVCVADITKYCKDKEEVIKIINNADHISSYNKRKLLEELGLRNNANNPTNNP